MNEVDPDWKERCERLLRSARVMLEDGDSDSAVSRAYYAMFFAAEALLASKGLTFSSHHAVVSAFGQEFSKTGILAPHLHRSLIEAAQARNASDYQIRSGITTKAAIGVIERAEEFVRAALRYLDSLRHE